MFNHALRLASDPATPSNDHNPALDGLRGAAMLLVILNHAIAVPLLTATTGFDTAVSKIAFGGWVGVDIFFVLSGFLITGILLDTAGRPGWWTSFIMRRGLRVFPYTANSIIEIARLRKLGVDGVFTDYPERVVKG